MFMLKQMNCVIIHIYRDGKQVADMLANHGLSIASIAFWNDPSLFITDCVNRNKLVIRSFRLCPT
jgi:hypothetical protein